MCIYIYLVMVDVTVLDIVQNISHILLDYKLIQSSETGSSVAMEKEGLRHCVNYLLCRQGCFN